MNGYLKSFFKQFLFWLLLFQSGRLIFLVYHVNKLHAASSSELLGAFYYAVPLDISAACYLSFIPWILITTQLFSSHTIISKALRIYFLLMTGLVCTILVSELEIYTQWGTKLSVKIFPYLTQPTEMVKSLSGLLFTMLLILATLYIFGTYTFYKRFVHEEPEIKKDRSLLLYLLALLIPVSLIIGLRGGIQQIPINQSAAYYCTKDVLNCAAVNPSWNLIQSIDQNSKMMNTNPFISMSMLEAKALRDSLYFIEKDTSIQVLRIKKPNIVLLILEGFSADNLTTLGGYKDAAPNLDSLCKKGLLFSNCYSSGDRSEQGMAAIFSGFPAQPTTSILRQPDKFTKLPSLTSSLKKAGYSTSFYFGGQLSYGNIKAFMIYNGIDQIVELDQFADQSKEGKLGIHDEVVLKRQLAGLQNTPQPFFSTLFTLSTHTPYDIPTAHKSISWAGENEGYINGVMYSDSCIGAYFSEAKKQAWYNNTVFVIVADHSHANPRNNDFYSPAHRKIPLLFFGPALDDAYAGKQITHTLSQVDLPATLLNQLGLDNKAYRWSKNALNPYSKEFAFNAYLDGSTGLILNDSNYYAYNKTMNLYHLDHFTDTSRRAKTIKTGSAYIQTLIQQYLEY